MENGLLRWQLLPLAFSIAACTNPSDGALQLPPDERAADAAALRDAEAMRLDAASVAVDATVGGPTEPDSGGHALQPESPDGSFGPPRPDRDAATILPGDEVSDQTVVAERDAATSRDAAAQPTAAASDAGFSAQDPGVVTDTTDMDASVLGTVDAAFETAAPAFSDASDWLDASWPEEPTCYFHTPPLPPALDGGVQLLPDGGTLDAGPPKGPHVQLLDSPYVGPFLADHDSYALYIYTADFPGDCSYPPISTCFDDCLIAWPIFEAGNRELGEGLDDGAFGTFTREDGLPQTTYYGWPLYYFKRDVEPEQTLGQSKGNVWFLAELVMPNLLPMRAPESQGGVKYLADGSGRTLYAHAGDDLGDSVHPPHSRCTGQCALQLRPFTVRSLRAASTLEPDELSIFVRDDGVQQVSYRGQPLYWSNADLRSGDMGGLLDEDLRLVEP